MSPFVKIVVTTSRTDTYNLPTAQRHNHGWAHCASALLDAELHGSAKQGLQGYEKEHIQNYQQNTDLHYKEARGDSTVGGKSWPQHMYSMHPGSEASSVALLTIAKVKTTAIHGVADL